MSTGPVTSLHYAANGDFVNGVYTPGVDGFNLADVESVSDVNALPAGMQGLVYLGMTGGVTSAFISAVDAFLGNSKVFGFYLADEPNPSTVSAANLKAESDYIHAHLPGVKTFIVEYNETSDTNPTYAFTPANTDIDLFGLDPYPVNTNVPNGLDYQIIPAAVKEAESIGIPLADIVPVYQTFGGGQYTTYGLPTPAEEQQILATWATVVPNPVFDYAYSWGTQVGDTALSNDPALAAVLAAHNAAETTPPSVSFNAAVGIAQPTATTAAIAVTGADSDSVGVKGVEIYNGSKALGAATLNANGTWSFKAALGLGSYTLSAIAANAGGMTAKAAASFSFTVGADTVTQVMSNNVTTKWTYNASGGLHDISHSRLLAEPYTSYDVIYGANGKAASAIYSNRASETWSYSTDGALVVTLTGGAGQNFKTWTDLYDTQGHLVAGAIDLNSGAGRLELYTSGLTATSGSGTLTLQAGTHTFSLTAHSSETIVAAASGGDTIDYQKGFGSSTISGFLGSGASHDTLQFASSMFTGEKAGASAADWSAMLLNGSAIQSGANVSITDLNKDTVTLASTQLSAITAGAASSLLFA